MMLLGIFIVIAIAGLVALGIGLWPSAKEEEYERLEREYDCANRTELYLSWDTPQETYKRYRAHTSEAYQKLQAFKEANPNFQKKQAKKEKLTNIGGGFAIGAGIVLIIMLIALIVVYSCAPGDQARLEAEYEVLSWEVENGIYQDGGDDVVGKKELYNQVREYNAKIAEKQAYADNIWVGIFIPDFYKELNPIEVN